MKKELQAAEEAIKKLEKEVAQHPWRLQYHMAPKANWMNDPNGFSYINGQYHLFYQHHPFSPQWGPMYWGHAVSSDLVTWQHEPVALAPDEAYDLDGCFSGSAIEKDGQLYVMYTGNVWTGPDQDTDLKQVQALAVSDDGIHFEKLTDNPVISDAPDGDIHPYHFRDPKVWERDGMYYCVLGSRTKDHQGQVLLYRSADLLNWTFMAVSAKAEGNMGYMWECPDLFELDGQDVLVFSPQGMEPEGDLYHNLHQAGYMMGELNYETGNFTHGAFQMLDGGFDYYAPQTTLDAKGRRIVIAWMDMWESPMPTQQHHWSGAMTIPRVMELEGDRIVTRPLPELSELRTDEVRHDVTVTAKQTLPGVSGACAELFLDLTWQEATHFTLCLRENEETGEKTTLTLERESGRITLDRSRSGEGVTGTRTVTASGDSVTIHVFLDHSSVEVFINGGEHVMTARIYPGEQSTGISFEADGEALISVQKWTLKKAIAE